MVAVVIVNHRHHPVNNKNTTSSSTTTNTNTNISKIRLFGLIRSIRRTIITMIMNSSVCCIITTFTLLVCCTLLLVIIVLSPTTNNNINNYDDDETRLSRFPSFKLYNPLSYKTLFIKSTKPSSLSSFHYHTNDYYYYPNTNHCIWDELLMDHETNNNNDTNNDNGNDNNQETNTKKNAIYELSDFQPNAKGYIPPYWNNYNTKNLQDTTITAAAAAQTRESSATSSSLCTNGNTCSSNGHDNNHNNRHGIEVGPCYVPNNSIDWKYEINKVQNMNASNDARLYHNHSHRNSNNIDDDDYSNYCRPGFIIIGAGKCGTSSLYHYLVDHPRIIPAREKQIHYFKPPNNKQKLKWYYDYFPTATSYLASSALLTGEASPGYLPYPDVPYLIRTRLTTTIIDNDNNEKNEKIKEEEKEVLESVTGTTLDNNNELQETAMSNIQKKKKKIYIGPKIITIGREPLSRAYSSYKYNYVTPTLEAFRHGRFTHRNISSDKRNEKPDSFYEQYLFTFEEMLQAELKVLKSCLSIPNGSAYTGAQQTWGNEPWIKNEFIRRSKLGLPPLAAMDDYCYGKIISNQIPKQQWAELIQQNPNKVIDVFNVYLKQALIGRGLYVIPLEWWYSIFPTDQLFFLCTEELSDLSGKALNELGDFLGLPPNVYNFSKSIASGAYNVAGYRGYDQETSWSEINKNEATPPENKNESFPLSPQLQKEIEDFVRPYNERLFELVGRRCNWR